MANGSDDAVQGTIRSDVSNDISSGFEVVTIRAIGADISAGVEPTGTLRNSSATINSGIKNITTFHDISKDNIVLEGIHYDYEKTISKSSGEAEIHLLSRDGMFFIFKLYYPNFKPKIDILNELKSLKHPDIINIVDFGFFHERFYELMEYAEGGTLEKYLPIRDIDEIKSTVDEIINALEYCHTRNIIHKDIKPENIYLKYADGSDILIGDFGISSILDEGMTRQLTSQNLTVGYAAPEMYGLGGKVYIGKEVDYYALGVTLIHIWLGKSPFEGLGIHAIANLTTTGKIPIPPDIPDELRKLIKGLLTIDYTKRWGYVQTTKWLKGIDVPVDDEPEAFPLVMYKFSIGSRQTIAVKSLAELTSVMKMQPNYAKKNLFRGHIINWVQSFNSELAAKVKEVVEDDYVDDQQAAYQKAIYLLNEDEPFVGAKGARCYNARDLARELREYKTHYEQSFSGQWFDCVNHPLFLYLEARGSKEQAEFFRKFLTNQSPKLVDIYIMLLEGKNIEDINKFFDDLKNNQAKNEDNDFDRYYEQAVDLWNETGRCTSKYIANQLGIDGKIADRICSKMKQNGMENHPVYHPKYNHQKNLEELEASVKKLERLAFQAKLNRFISKYWLVTCIGIFLMWAYFSSNSSSSSSSSGGASQILTVKTSANLRSGPNQNSVIVTTVSAGENVEMILTDGNWYKVKYKSSAGYIHKNLIK